MMFLLRCQIIFLAILWASLPAVADQADSLVMVEEVEDISLWKPNGKQVILPASLIAAGAVGASVKWWQSNVDDKVCGSLSAGRSLRVADYAQYLPYAGFLGAEYLGARPKAGITDRALLTATSFIILEAITQPLKRVAHRLRPDMSDNHSFPSGHTATAFAGAELTRIVYGDVLGACSYVVATGVAALRIAGSHHYLTDCIAGAGIGILSSRIACWLIPLERRWLSLDRPSAQAEMALIPLAFDRGVGLALSLSL